MWKVIKRRGYDIEYWIATEINGVEYALEARYDDEYDAKVLCDRLNGTDRKRLLAEAADKIDSLENQVYNLNLYLKFVQDKYPQLFNELMDHFEGMGGYTGRT